MDLDISFESEGCLFDNSGPIRDRIMQTPYKEGDAFRFGRLCVTWQSLNNGINELTTNELWRLMRYILEQRPHNKTYLHRIVARFNALNKLSVEELMP